VKSHNSVRRRLILRIGGRFERNETDARMPAAILRSGRPANCLCLLVDAGHYFGFFSKSLMAHSLHSYSHEFLGLKEKLCLKDGQRLSWR